MRNFYLKGFLCLTIGLLLSSCGEKKTSVDDGLKFGNFSYDVIAQIADEDTVAGDGGAYCRVSGQGVLPEKIGSLDITELRDSLIRLAEIIVVNKDLTQPSLDEELSLTDKNPDQTEACSVMVNELSICLITPQLVVWRDYSYSYPCGAAHGMFSTTYVNYSLIKGSILSLADIFGSDYKEKLAGLIRQKIKDQNVTLLVEPEEISVPSDFRITTGSIEFLFSLYEIAPYSEGEVKVELSRYEIEDLFLPGMEETIYGLNYD